jgi:pyruvate-formate lyase-activating enzyme
MKKQLKFQGCGVADWYCPLPFRHAFVDSVGVAACCQTPRQQVPLDQWSNNSYLKDLQRQILQGQIPEVCSGCRRQELVQGRSLRTDSQIDYDYQRFVDTKIEFVDYRASNICNFKCRSCDPAFSHGIAAEARNNTVIADYYQVVDTKTVSINATNIEWVRKNLTRIKRLMFTGGEPTYMPEIQLLVESIVYDQLDIDVMITTNASFVNDFWCEATRLYPRLHWTVSLDAVGPAAEIVRHGTKWSVVERNVRWLSQHAASMDVNTVVTNLNVMQLLPLLTFVREIQGESKAPRGLHGDQGCRHQFHVSQRPDHLSADNLSPDLQSNAIDHLTQCLTLDLNSEQQYVPK